MTLLKTRAQVLRSLLLICALAILLQAPASSAPIPFFGGMLDAHLRQYDEVESTPGVTYVLTHEYVLGVDFMPGVPMSFLDPAAPHPYTASFGNTNPLGLSTNAVGLAVTGDTFDAWFHTSVALDTGCGSVPGVDSPPRALIVLRGVCAFNQKWTNIENAGWGAGIVISNDSGAIPGVGGIVSEHTIPFALVTQEVGDELHGGSVFTPLSGHAGFIFPVISLDVAWTPNAVPQPGTLTLLGLGLAGFAWRRRRR